MSYAFMKSTINKACAKPNSSCACLKLFICTFVMVKTIIYAGHRRLLQRRTTTGCVWFRTEEPGPMLIQVWVHIAAFAIGGCSSGSKWMGQLNLSDGAWDMKFNGRVIAVGNGVIKLYHWWRVLWLHGRFMPCGAICKKDWNSIVPMVGSEYIIMEYMSRLEKNDYVWYLNQIVVTGRFIIKSIIKENLSLEGRRRCFAPVLLRIHCVTGVEKT